MTKQGTERALYCAGSDCVSFGFISAEVLFCFFLWLKKDFFFSPKLKKKLCVR